MNPDKQKLLLWWCPAGVRRRRDKLLRNRQRRSFSADWSAAAVWPFLLSVLTEQEEHETGPQCDKGTHRHWTINSKSFITSYLFRVSRRKVRLWPAAVTAVWLQDLSPTFILPGTDWLQHNPSPVRLCLTSGGKLLFLNNHNNNHIDNHNKLLSGLLKIQNKKITE